jgi:hypothetical protein
VIASVAYGKDAPQLSQAELIAAYKAAGLIERSGKWLDACRHIIEPKTQVIDLNGDGRSEVFVVVSSNCYGMAGAQLFLLIKEKSGGWKVNLDIPAGGYKLLSTGSAGFPDIEISSPGVCSPVWRWNGDKYAILKSCER